MPSISCGRIGFRSNACCHLPSAQKEHLPNVNQEHCPAKLDVSDINGKEQQHRMSALQQPLLQTLHMGRYLAPQATITNAAGARNASRQLRFDWNEIEQMESNGGTWGRLSIPYDLTRTFAKNTPDAADAGWRIIKPLVSLLQREGNLARNRYSQLVATRAIELQITIKTVWRLLNRYYYFGQEHASLRMLAPGRHPTELAERRTPASLSTENANSDYQDDETASAESEDMRSQRRVPSRST